MFTHPQREREREFIFIFSRIKPTHRVNIKPHNMACVSPRVFWNIVRHCQVSFFFLFINIFLFYLTSRVFFCISRVFWPGFDVIVIFFLGFILYLGVSWNILRHCQVLMLFLFFLFIIIIIFYFASCVLFHISRVFWNIVRHCQVFMVFGSSFRD